jgi:hypothetical protein
MLRIRRPAFNTLALLFIACGGPPSDPAPTFDAAPAGPTGPRVSNAQGTNATGNSDRADSPMFDLDEDLPAEGGLAPENVCAGVVHEGERLPLDMYFLVDLSGSMAELGPGGTKWDLVSRALVAFLQEPRNADIGVGIGYFPLAAELTCVAGDEGCLCIPFINLCLPNFGGSCAVADYAAPSVPLSLPPQPQVVVDSILSQIFAGGTPTRPALEGAIQYANTWAEANPGRRTVVVLATDGDPSGCIPNAPQDVAAAAAAALNGPNRIQTFVIGVGRSLASLNLVASAGGTTQAFLTDTSGNLVQELADALAKIRNQAGPCAFELAGQSSMQTIDPNQVNVRYVPPGAAAPIIVPKTSGGSASDCSADGGWHYDDPLAPTRIELCDATCAAAAGARLEVEFGCETIIAPR